MIQYWLIVIFLRAHQTNTGSEKKKLAVIMVKNWCNKAFKTSVFVPSAFANKNELSR